MVKKTDYVNDNDRLRAMDIGPQGKEEYTILRDYIQLPSGARTKWSKSAYVNLFCGPCETSRSPFREPCRQKVPETPRQC